MMKTIGLKLVKTVDESYPIYLGTGIYRNSIEKIIGEAAPSSVAFISDSRVGAIYFDSLRALHIDCPVSYLTFKAGEKQKNIGTVTGLFSGLVKSKLDRKSLIIAFGGGVTGDVAGFLASIYLRGIPFVQVPTSLLAMVDSSIGGKTGVDTAEGKNLLGRFCQPEAVIIDIEFLSTLPRPELVNGMAEIIKHALIKDPDYYRSVRDNPGKVLALDRSFLSEIVEASCRIKAEVVEKDEKEAGLRQILNFGHTAGHAIEKASRFRVPHGYAVAMGMIVESHISFSRGLLSRDDLEGITKIVSLYGLDRYVHLVKRISPAKIAAASITDKKNVGGVIRAVLLRKTGEVFRDGGAYSSAVSLKEIEAGLDYLG
ncbi:MAG: 3-dehydroquinate synthase [Brevinematales bacterium]|jgi:3-dehydroquinate synthase